MPEDIAEKAEDLTETPDGLCEMPVIAQKKPMIPGEEAGPGADWF